MRRKRRARMRRPQRHTAPRSFSLREAAPSSLALRMVCNGGGRSSSVRSAGGARLSRRDVDPGDTHCVIMVFNGGERSSFVCSAGDRMNLQILYHSCKGSDGKEAFGVHSMELNP